MSSSWWRMPAVSVVSSDEFPIRLAEDRLLCGIGTGDPARQREDRTAKEIAIELRVAVVEPHRVAQRADHRRTSRRTSCVSCLDSNSPTWIVVSCGDGRVVLIEQVVQLEIVVRRNGHERVRRGQPDLEFERSAVTFVVGAGIEIVADVRVVALGDDAGQRHGVRQRRDVPQQRVGSSRTNGRPKVVSPSM